MATETITNAIDYTNIAELAVGFAQAGMDMVIVKTPHGPGFRPNTEEVQKQLHIHVSVFRPASDEAQDNDSAVTLAAFAIAIQLS